MDTQFGRLRIIQKKWALFCACFLFFTLFVKNILHNKNAPTGRKIFQRKGHFKMQESKRPNDVYLAALNRIADELAKFRKAMRPEHPVLSDEERAEEVRNIQRSIFGDED